MNRSITVQRGMGKGPAATGLRLAELWRDQRGTSVIEMSFILPVLVLMVCGAADFGMAFLQQIKIQQAAARTMEMALAYKSPTTALSPSIIDAEGAVAYGLASGDPNGQVTPDMWLECSGVRQSNYTDTCATGTPARYASVVITDSYSMMFQAVVPTANSMALRGFAEVRLQ